MKTHSIKTQDIDARSFYGVENSSFETDIAMIASHDPRLLKVFRNVRARYLAETDQRSEGRA